MRTEHKKIIELSASMEGRDWVIRYRGRVVGRNAVAVFAKRAAKNKLHFEGKTWDAIRWVT